MDALFPNNNDNPIADRNKHRQKMRFRVAFWRQIRHQWPVTLLLGLALCGVVALYTYARNSQRFQNRSIQLIEKDAGHNLWFVASDAGGFEAFSGDADLPLFADTHIQELIADRRIASTYWGNVLQARVVLRGRDVLLTGVDALDDHQITEEKAHLLEQLDAGEADVGYSLARIWDLSEGDRLALEDRVYTVRQVKPQRGTLDDERLWIPLQDAQQWLDKPGKSNLILGFLCMRGLSLEEGLHRLQQRLGEEHGDLQLQVIPLMSMLEARALSRFTTSRYLRYLLLAVVSVCILLIGAVGCMEVNERRYELAIMLAMGAGYRFLFSFFIAKLALLAVVASVVGFLVGSFLYVYWLTPVLVVHTQPVAIVWSTLPRTILLTVLVAGIAAVVPLIHILQIDPTQILAEE